MPLLGIEDLVNKLKATLLSLPTMINAGPLTILRVWGTILPCCESSENRSARQSLVGLNRLGTRIAWHTAKKQNSRISAAGGFMKSIFGRSNSNDSCESGQSDKEATTPAQLRVVDAVKDSINNGEPYPELQICPLKSESESNGDTNDSSGPLRANSAMSFQLDIPLHHIQRIESIDTTLIAIYTKDVHAISERSANMEKEAARISLSSSSDRDSVSIDLKVLVEWNKQRQPEVEEDLPAAGIRHRAQKAAHFAKREIEMREKKRDREKRKAGHMKDMNSGGLKYTAIAMANQIS